MKYFSPREYAEYLYSKIYNTISPARQSEKDESLKHSLTVVLCTNCCLSEIIPYCAFDNGFFKEAAHEIHSMKMDDHLQFDRAVYIKVQMVIINKSKTE